MLLVLQLVYIFWKTGPHLSHHLSIGPATGLSISHSQVLVSLSLLCTNTHTLLPKEFHSLFQFTVRRAHHSCISSVWFHVICFVSTAICVSICLHRHHELGWVSLCFSWYLCAYAAYVDVLARVLVHLCMHFLATTLLSMFLGKLPATWCHGYGWSIIG